MYVYVWSLFLPPSGELWNWRKLKQHEHMLYTVATRLSSDNSASRKKESKKESKQSSNKEWMNEWTHEWIMDEGMYVCEGMNEWFTLFHPFVLKAVWTNTSFTKCGALYTIYKSIKRQISIPCKVFATLWHKLVLKIVALTRTGRFRVTGYFDTSEVHQIIPKIAFNSTKSNYPIYALPISKRLKLHSASLYDKPFSRYRPF